MSFSASDLSVLAYANNFTLWHYITTDEDVTVDGYFDKAYDMLCVNDLIIGNTDAEGTPKTAFYIVKSRTEKSIIVTPYG